MNSIETYRRVKINWWIIFTLVVLNGGICIDMIFAYIHQWGNNPIPNMTVLLALISIFVLVGAILPLIFVWRFKLVIDDKFVTFRAGLLSPCKIEFAMIKNISVKQVKKSLSGHINHTRKNIKQYSLDFVTQSVKIQLKNGKIYYFNIKDAEIVKKEIEKRIINDITSTA